MDKIKIAKNSLYLFGGVLFGMVSAIVSVRVVIDNLGVLDYGIFSAVGSASGLMLIINNLLSSSTQRFLSIELGRGDYEAFNRKMNASVGIHVTLGLFVLLFGNIVGDKLLTNFMNFPSERLDVVWILYQLSLWSIFLTIAGAPYVAVMTAKEEMHIIAASNMLRSFLFLVVSLSLYLTDHDKLLVYGILIFGVSLAITIYQFSYPVRRYTEIRHSYRLLTNMHEIREQLKFTGWNTAGAIASLSLNQGMAVLLNVNFGPLANAAFGIANQISAQLSAFSTTMMKAVRPQIAKAHGADDRYMMNTLSLWSCKYSTLLMSLFAVPIVVEIRFLMHIWLGNIPDFALEMAVFIIFAAFVNQLTIGLIASIQAVGLIAKYQIVTGSLLIFSLPLAEIMTRFGWRADSVVSAILFTAVAAAMCRVWFATRLTGLSWNRYLVEVLLPLAQCILPAFLAAVFLAGQMETGWIRLCSVSTVFLLVICSLGWRYVVSEGEKSMLLSLFQRLYLHSSK